MNCEQESKKISTLESAFHNSRWNSYTFTEFVNYANNTSYNWKTLTYKGTIVKKISGGGSLALGTNQFGLMIFALHEDRAILNFFQGSAIDWTIDNTISGWVGPVLKDVPFLKIDQTAFDSSYTFFLFEYV